MRNLSDFKKLKHLIIDSNHFFTKRNQGLVNLIKETKIEIFSLKNCNIGDEGGKAIGKALRELFMAKEKRDK